MTSSYQDYTLLNEDDPFVECYEWFWVSLGEDNVYPKDFLEELMQMADDVQTGKVKTYPIEDVMKELQELIGKEDDEDQLTN